MLYHRLRGCDFVCVWDSEMAAAAASTEWADESEYERQRRENIAANARLLLSLGLDTAGLGLVHGHSFLHPPYRFCPRGTVATSS